MIPAQVLIDLLAWDAGGEVLGCCPSRALAFTPSPAWL